MSDPPQLPAYSPTGIATVVDPVQNTIIYTFYQNIIGGLQRRTHEHHAPTDRKPADREMRLGTPLAAVVGPDDGEIQVYAISKEFEVIGMGLNGGIITTASEFTKLSAITDGSAIWLYYQERVHPSEPEKQNQVVEHNIQTGEVRRIISNALPGTNLTSHITKPTPHPVELQRHIVYHSTANELYCIQLSGLSNPIMPLPLPITSLYPNSAVALVDVSDEFVLYFLNRESKIQFIKRGPNGWGTPTELPGVNHVVLEGTSLAAANDSSANPRTVFITYQAKSDEIHSVHHTVPA